MAFSIPDSYADAIRIVAELEAGEVTELVLQLKLIEPKLLATSVLKSLPERWQVKLGNGTDLVEFLISAHKIQLTLDEPFEVIVEGLRDAANEILHDENLLASFTSNCLGLLSEDTTLRVSAKAIDLFADNAAGFKSSRILSDIRPVFMSEGEVTNPKAAIINHTLKIDYGEREGPKQIFIAMDYLDLLQLQTSVERAIEKESYLKGSLLASEIIFLSPQDES